MQCGIRRTAVCWIALGVAVISGCRQEAPDQEPQAGPPAVVEQEGPLTEEAPTVAEETPEEPAPPPKIPDVVMTDAMAATNVVSVGDPMPEGSLPDLEGKTRTIEEMFGPNLTVVFFWNSENLYALQELQDLQIDVYEPYQDKGVQVVGINVKDDAEAVKQKVEQAGATYPQLLDADGSYFARVAKEHLPRTYLVGPDGKNLWFDLEYSTATRRNLLQAIQVALAQTGTAESPATAEPSAGSPEAKAQPSP